MRPQDLQSPFRSKERQVLVEDGIWYIPPGCEKDSDFQFPGWSDSIFFGKDLPLCIEYCSGNGHWIAAKAKENPACHWIAVEYDFDRARKIWSKVKNEQLSNLFIVCGEGFAMTHRYIPSQSIRSIFINFPDPWPKRRHAKFRLIQIPFIQEICRILQPEGELTMVTDDEKSSDEFIDLMQRFTSFQSVYSAPYFVSTFPNYGFSSFDQLWREQGKTIRYHLFRKIK